MVGARWLFTALLVLMVVERLIELAVSQRNQRWLESRGAVELGGEHYPWMVLQHGLFLLCCLLEVWLLTRPFYPALAAAMLVLLMLSMALRYWVMATLGRRWTTRVFCLPGQTVITVGPYRYLRHPNYLAVAVEIVALPMVHTAWSTAAVFSVANAVLLWRRIQIEEAGLRHYNQFDSGFGSNRGR